MTQSTITPVTHGRSQARDAQWGQRWDYIQTRHRGMSPTAYAPEHHDHDSAMKRTSGGTRTRSIAVHGVLVYGLRWAIETAPVVERVADALQTMGPSSSYEIALHMGSEVKTQAVGAILKRLNEAGMVRVICKERRGAPAGNTAALSPIWRWKGPK